MPIPTPLSASSVTDAPVDSAGVAAPTAAAEKPFTDGWDALLDTPYLKLVHGYFGNIVRATRLTRAWSQVVAGIVRR